MPGQPPPPPVSGPTGSPSPPTSSFNIGEEFSGARRNLPPAGIVLICIAAVALILGAYAYFGRAKPQGAGSIDFVSAVDVPGQNHTMVAITLTLRNGSQRSLWIRTLKGRLTAADDKTFEDEAASAVDFDRFFQAFPALKENSKPPVPPETRLLPGTTQSGTIIVSFPVTKDVFDQRKAVDVVIQPYDQPVPIVLTKQNSPTG